MLRLGLAQGLVPTDPDQLTPELARRIAALGVTRITTHFDVPPGSLAGSRGREIADLLADAGIRIAQCAGLSPDLVSPDAEVRAASIAALADLMRAARSLGAQMVLGGCGSLHPTFNYGPARENHLPETRERLIGSLRELARHAEDAGMPVALECHLLTTLDSAEHVREIFDAVDSPFAFANFDPVNFIGSLEAVYDSGAVAEHVARTIGPRLAPSVHIKDLVVEPDLVLKIAEVPPGTGIMDLDGVLESCRHLPEDSSLIVEHFGPEESAAALRYVAALAERHGMLSSARS
jgi:sugar phosphate isomerase/epimerase